jgi:hypothetical protein
MGAADAVRGQRPMRHLRRLVEHRRTLVDERTVRLVGGDVIARFRVMEKL